MKKGKLAEKMKWGLLAFLILFDIALGTVCWIRDRKAEETVWIGSYPMVNANITYEIPRFPGSGGWGK